MAHSNKKWKCTCENEDKNESKMTKGTEMKIKHENVNGVECK